MAENPIPKYGVDLTDEELLKAARRDCETWIENMEKPDKFPVYEIAQWLWAVLYLLEQQQPRDEADYKGKVQNVLNVLQNCGISAGCADLVLRASLGGDDAFKKCYVTLRLVNKFRNKGWSERKINSVLAEALGMPPPEPPDLLKDPEGFRKWRVEEILEDIEGWVRARQGYISKQYPPLVKQDLVKQCDDNIQQSLGNLMQYGISAKTLHEAMEQYQGRYGTEANVELSLEDKVREEIHKRMDRQVTSVVAAEGEWKRLKEKYPPELHPIIDRECKKVIEDLRSKR